MKLEPSLGLAGMKNGHPVTRGSADGCEIHFAPERPWKDFRFPNVNTNKHWNMSGLPSIRVSIIDIRKTESRVSSSRGDVCSALN